ncbi:preprotein translocase subunit SecG [Lignipirellula cremea]|uniref:Protein-export membrane protein SecG n=1 Tax=Lignipirellula cremea TaxID=2528010 RepID=A0A518DQY3_9BACT|nr:preprotein translocase subunit SecG [Lignipirellula cremea]QDU94239.1 preprotein translocase subunit SecG [Lignipirellula cremea]
MQFFFGFMMFVVALFLILLILVQRGKGGGLSGALGGMGGESAFGSKAGDLFTRITIGTALVWILLCILSIKMLKTEPLLETTSVAPAGESLVPGVNNKNPDATDGAATDGGIAPPASTPATSTPPAAAPATGPALPAEAP